MTEDVEHIHAKLCDYLEGNLPPAERAEIDALLAANPHHAALMTDLAAQRQMLRRLPRATAPADLADELRSQLERQALLGESDAIPLRPRLAGIRRWPGALATAAAVAVAAGFGLIVYSVLPTGRPAITLAPTGSPGLQPEWREQDAPPADALAEADKDAAVRSGDVREPAVGKAASDAIAGVGGGAVGQTGQARVAPQEGSAVAHSQKEQTPSQFGIVQQPANRVVLEVVAGDPEAVNNGVLRYFASNSIAWTGQDAVLPVARDRGGDSGAARTDGLAQFARKGAEPDPSLAGGISRVPPRPGEAAAEPRRSDRQRAAVEDGTGSNREVPGGRSAEAQTAESRAASDRLSGQKPPSSPEPPAAAVATGLAVGEAGRQIAAAQLPAEAEKRRAEQDRRDQSLPPAAPAAGERRTADEKQDTHRQQLESVAQAQQAEQAPPARNYLDELAQQAAAVRVIHARNMTERQVAELAAEIIMANADEVSITWRGVAAEGRPSGAAREAQHSPSRGSGQQRNLADSVSNYGQDVSRAEAPERRQEVESPAPLARRAVKASSTLPAAAAPKAEHLSGGRAQPGAGGDGEVSGPGQARAEPLADCVIILRSAPAAQTRLNVSPRQSRNPEPPPATAPASDTGR